MLTYKDCEEREGSLFRIKKAIREGRLHKMAKGIYSDTGDESELEVLQKRYPESVATLETAYYCYNLSDNIPDRYCFATAANARRIKDSRVRQCYVPAKVLWLGAKDVEFLGEKVRTYDLERLLIETARMKCAMPPDLYKEVILAFRGKVNEMYPAKIGDYLKEFPKRDLIERIVYEEVF